MILHLKNRLETIASASETIGRIDIELERLRAIIATNDAKVAHARENYVEMRTQFIRTLVKAETKADFDALLADYHGLVNAGLSQCALNAGNSPVHQAITKLLNERQDAVGYRERAWDAVVQGNEPAPWRADDPTPPATAETPHELGIQGHPFVFKGTIDRLAEWADQQDEAVLNRSFLPPTWTPPPPAQLDRDQATALSQCALSATTIQDHLLAVVREAGIPISVAAVHQAVAAKFSLAQVRDNLVLLARKGKVQRKERGIYVSQCALSAT